VPSAETFSKSFAESLSPLDAEYFLFKQKYGVSFFFFFYFFRNIFSPVLYLFDIC